MSGNFQSAKVVKHQNRISVSLLTLDIQANTSYKSWVWCFGYVFWVSKIQNLTRWSWMSRVMWSHGCWCQICFSFGFRDGELKAVKLLVVNPTNGKCYTGSTSNLVKLDDLFPSQSKSMHHVYIFYLQSPCNITWPSQIDGCFNTLCTLLVHKLGLFTLLFPHFSKRIEETSRPNKEERAGTEPWL